MNEKKWYGYSDSDIPIERIKELNEWPLLEDGRMDALVGLLTPYALPTDTPDDEQLRMLGFENDTHRFAPKTDDERRFIKEVVRPKKREKLKDFPQKLDEIKTGAMRSEKEFAIRENPSSALDEIEKQARRADQAQADKNAAEERAKTQQVRADTLEKIVRSDLKDGADAKCQLKKAKQASCATLKEAIEYLNRFAGEADQRIAQAAQLYVMPEWRTLQKVATKMGVSKATISSWFNIFEEKTGFNLGRPKPRENFSVRAQTEVIHKSGNERNKAQTTDMESDGSDDVFTKHD
jgi:hypothetical protein